MDINCDNLTVECFEKEITILEKLHYHKNIVRYLFHEHTNKKLRLFMTKYSCNLRDILIERTVFNKGPYFPSDISRFALDIIRGLEFLHKNNVLHRDLKTDNIFVSLNERKLISFLSIGDFDTAKIISRRAGAKTVIGTPSYMAPEVFQSNAKNSGYTLKADIFSFGMVLYELISLMRPYEGCSNFDIPDYIIKHKFPEFPEKN